MGRHAVFCLLLWPHFTRGETEAGNGGSLPQTRDPRIQSWPPPRWLPPPRGATLSPASTSVETHSDTLSNLQLHLIVWLPWVQFENKDGKGSKHASEARSLEKRQNEIRHIRFRGLPLAFCQQRQANETV